MPTLSELDAIILERMRQHMQQPDTEAAFQDFAEVEDEVVCETSETLKDIERDIAATKALIARIKAQVESGKRQEPFLHQDTYNRTTFDKKSLF